MWECGNEVLMMKLPFHIPTSHFHICIFTFSNSHIFKFSNSHIFLPTPACSTSAKTSSAKSTETTASATTAAAPATAAATAGIPQHTSDDPAGARHRSATSPSAAKYTE
jgi:hypothetical protein